MLAQISPHLPVLQVAVPLVSAPLALILRKADLAWGFALAVTWVSFAMSCLLLGQVLDSGPISYDIGGWPSPWGIVYYIDAANALVLVIVSGIGALVTSSARQGVFAEIAEESQAHFYALLLLCFAGLLGVVATGDAFNVFVFLEISSLSTYTLVALGAHRDKRALSASINYLIAGTIGATFFVIGVGLLYMATGTLNMADLATRIADIGDSRTLRVAMAFIVIGLGLKLALFPLHLWLPNAYTYAPSVVTSFLAATSTKVAVYVMMRFVFTVFGVHFSFEQLSFAPMALFLALAGMIMPSLVAVYQVNVKRMLAYSSVAQISYMVLGLSLASVASLSAAIIHLFNHALMKGALFMAIGAVVMRVGSSDLKAFSGLGRQMPWTMAAIVGGGLSLMGVPLTVGFVSKWLLMQAYLEAGLWWVAVAIVISSLIAVIYVWRIIEQAYLAPAPAGRDVKEAPLSLLIPVWVLVLANFYFGIDASLTTRVARLAGEALLGGGVQ